MSGRRSYVARHRHGRPGLFDVAVLMATWPPLRPLRRRWFTRSTRREVSVAAPVVAMPSAPIARPAAGLLSRRAA